MDVGIEDNMGTGTKYYCMCCLDQKESYQLDPEMGWCFGCLDTLSKVEEQGKKEEEKV